MSDQEGRPEQGEEDVEGHLIKEALATGAAATAFLGAGAAGAQVAPGDPGLGAAKASQPERKAPRQVENPGGGASGSQVVLPGPGSGGSQVAPGEGSSAGGKAGAKKKKKAARPARHGRK